MTSQPFDYQNSSLFQMNQQREQSLSQQQSFLSGNEIRFPRGDHPVVLFYFAGNGNEGDQFIKYYKAHAIPSIGSKSGTPYEAVRYCPRANGDGNQCTYCDQGFTKIKDRFSIWMFILNILHDTTNNEKPLPQVNFESQVLFNEELKSEGFDYPGAFRIWHTSAWSESPWNGIQDVARMYQGLHNFLAQMVVSGDDLKRRYRINARPNTQPFPPEIYERAKVECQPIGKMLLEQMASPVVADPNAAAASPVQAQQNGQHQRLSAWAPPGASVGSVVQNPFANAPLNPFGPQTPADKPMEQQVQAAQEATPEPVKAEEPAPPPLPAPEVKPEPEKPASDRPLKNLF